MWTYAWDLLDLGFDAALEELRDRAKLASAGFEAIGIEPTRVYDIEDAREFLTGKGVDVDAIAPQVESKFMSAFVRAKKPLSVDAAKAEACCAPKCCGSGGKQ
jgi:transposase